ncbi:MAG: hypothetical protein HYU57_04575 [Micavibrio aeruginosavorus]|nr:hypothetical protein [Micavibrio aeruginosavorus]
MAQNTEKNTTNSLKNMDFLAWQINRIKASQRKEEVNRIFNSRARLRSELHLN